MDDLGNKSKTDSENSLTVFEVRSSDEESTLANNRFTKANEYHDVPPPIIGNPLTPRADISFAGLDEYAFRNKIIESKTTETNKTVGTTNEATIVKPKSVNETVVSKSKINRDEVIIEDWTSDDEDDVCADKTVSSVKPNVTQAVRSQADKSGQTLQKQGIAVLTRAGLVNTNRSNVSTARSISTVRPVRPVSTARPLASKIAQSNSVIRPNHPRLDIVRPKASNTPIKRSYFTQPVYRPKDLKPDVKTFGVKNMTTIGTRAVVSKGKGNPEILLQDHAVVDSGCSSHMTGNKAYLSDYEDLNGGFMAFGSDPKGGNLEILLQDHIVVDSGCSSHMTGNKAYLSDYEDFNGGFVAFGSDPKRGNSPSISFMRPFRCPLTILNTLDSLRKFDGKSDEGYLLEYSTTSKTFRVYNKRTKRVEENLPINFLEDQPNVIGTGPNWMFDLYFLTNSMNYIPVSVENQVNVNAGTQDSYVAGSSGKDKGPTQEYILLPLQSHRTRIPVEDVAPAAHEKPSKSSPKDNDVQDSKDVTDKEGQHQMTEDEQVLHDELEKMIAQEVVAKALDDATRQAFEEEKRNIASQKRAAQTTSITKLSTGRSSVSTATTLYVSAASTPTGANAGKSSFVDLRG
ncbi:hypothetical protein Tco_1502127 [Tanacetum coccineum]